MCIEELQTWRSDQSVTNQYWPISVRGSHSLTYSMPIPIPIATKGGVEGGVVVVGITDHSV